MEPTGSEIWNACIQGDVLKVVFILPVSSLRGSNFAWQMRAAYVTATGISSDLRHQNEFVSGFSFDCEPKVTFWLPFFPPRRHENHTGRNLAWGGEQSEAMAAVST